MKKKFVAEFRKTHSANPDYRSIKDLKFEPHMFMHICIGGLRELFSEYEFVNRDRRYLRVTITNYKQEAPAVLLRFQYCDKDGDDILGVERVYEDGTLHVVATCYEDDDYRRYTVVTSTQQDYIILNSLGEDTKEFYMLLEFIDNDSE